MFASWSGGITTGHGDSGLEIVEINGLYAAKLGFQHGQEVMVTGQDIHTTICASGSQATLAKKA